MLLASAALEGNNDVPLVYVGGSGNNLLDGYFLDQLQQVVGSDVPLVQVTGASPALPTNIPLITIGPKALTAALEKHPQSPIIATLISQQFFRSLDDAVVNAAGRPPVTAVFYDVPLLRQALTGQAILPQARRIALLATPESAHLYDDLLQQLGPFGLEARLFIAQEADELIPALVRALYYGDFLLAAQDPSIYNPRTIKHILLTAYRRNIMMIGPGQAYVKAGALASSYAPYSAVAKAVAESLRQWFRAGNLPAPDHPEIFKVQINQQVGRSLNIPLPTAESVEEQVREQLVGVRPVPSDGASASGENGEVL